MIFLKRWVFSVIGLLGMSGPLYWALERDHAWSGGMTVLSVIGAVFLALGMFGTRGVVNEADISF
jgi:hypothetical protein